MNPVQITPVEQLEPALWVKRDDLYEVAGVRGGKARTCYHLASQPGALGLVTAGSRSSPQVNIVAHVARHLNLPCRVHTPTGELSPEVLQAREAGAEVIQHKGGYNTTIIARARDDAKRLGWVNIPFGMECFEATEQTSLQVESLCGLVAEGSVERIVVPVGSGMSLCGILHGVEKYALWDAGLKSVLGVRVGSDPTKRLLNYGPRDSMFGSGLGQSLVPSYLASGRLGLLDSGTDYHQPAPESHVLRWSGLVLDPHYEAKCVPHLRSGDLLWVVGVRRSAVGDQA